MEVEEVGMGEVAEEREKAGKEGVMEGEVEEREREGEVEEKEREEGDEVMEGEAEEKEREAVAETEGKASSEIGMLKL